ncbi:DUF3306 domain-containing protein [Maribius pontilimi]|uniref:DUF3306 domain-containing protein n=1 Tax=Palleronia pontilimi TaxID=1964209 RepID=A0A934IH02_9RHOB|nr:DUF3306 domain-containing protein [Palleronia pontilimi]MBJ3764212.1 DUF3306 domain-containing protein [Palleronia pontilimi]
MKSERDFWSRRRAKVEAEDEAARAQSEERDAAQAQAALAERPEDEVLSELGLPAPETVCSGEEVRAFMAKSVPEYLRRRALRSLWRSNPVLACLDGLNDYDGDFTNAATDAPGVKTAYQVGKGLKAHLDYLADAEERAEDTSDVVEDAAEDETDEAPVTVADAAVVDETAGTPEAPVADAPDAARPRRMAFRFETGAA